MRRPPVSSTVKRAVVLAGVGRVDFFAKSWSVTLGDDFRVQRPGGGGADLHLSQGDLQGGSQGELDVRPVHVKCLF